VRYKYKQADDDGEDCAEEDGASGYVFSDFGEGVVLGRGEVDTEFEDGVEHLGDEDDDDGEEDDSELDGRDAEYEAGEEGKESDAEMYTHVELGAEDIHEAAKGIAEASDESGPCTLRELWW